MPETNYVPDPRANPPVWTASRNYGNSSPQQIYTGSAPPTAPDDRTLPAIFYPTGGGPELQWNVATQAWL